MELPSQQIASRFKEYEMAEQLLLQSMANQLAAIKDVLTAAKSRKFSRKQAADMLGICLRTFISYHETYKLPIASPRNRKAIYTYDELKICSEILEKAGKLRHGSIFSLQKKGQAIAI